MKWIVVVSLAVFDKHPGIGERRISSCVQPEKP